MKTLIKELVEITGPSGYEEKIRDFVIGKIKDHVDSYEVDALGNLIVRKGKKASNGKVIMLAAHLDEIGIMVTHVDDNGFARFSPLGGVFPRNTAGGRVRFLNGHAGVIGMEPGGTIKSVPDLSKMYIDLGATNKKNCPVEIGDVACFERTFTDLGDRIVAKAIDDRVGVAILIAILKAYKSGPNEIVGVFTTQEEVGTRGVAGAAYGIDPDIGIAIDVTITGDTPNATVMEVALGKGPAIKIKDSGMIADPKIVKWMEAGAKRANIPFQREILAGGSTDARTIQLTRGGVPSGCLSIPCRYVHSPSEMIDINDVNQSVKLLGNLISEPIILK